MSEHIFNRLTFDGLLLCRLIVFSVIRYGVSIVFLFFFQAEDGIRDLVRSRGLGDVYKRQAFATAYVQNHQIGEQFTLSGAVLDEFRVYLSERGIQPNINEWSKDRGWIENRLKQEMFNLALGVAKGDEVEVQRDPVIQRALSTLEN